MLLPITRGQRQRQADDDNDDLFLLVLETAGPISTGILLAAISVAVSN